MFSPHKHLFLCVILYVLNSKSCLTEPVVPPMLALYSPGEPEYTDVLVKHVDDNLTLVCELRGDVTHRSYVWNYVPDNGTLPSAERPFTIEPTGPAPSSRLMQSGLQLTDSGRYMCSVPPFSLTKYILVQNRVAGGAGAGAGAVQCARGALRCGARCVLAAYLCDGRRDCARGEDEGERLCDAHVCTRPDKLNCSSGRCISERACCRGGGGGGGGALCQQPSCCLEYTARSTLEGYVEAEFPPLFEDRHAPDDYGFIQSTIYTVTACALIFMIAVVLLVSAICKMQMKRAALRGYTHADRAARRRYQVQYHQAAQFPPCYEASRLLEAGAGAGAAPPSPASPDRDPRPEQGVAQLAGAGAGAGAAGEPPRGLARLSAIFSARYDQVPSQPADVELRHMPPGGRGPSSPLDEYRSPAYCDLGPEFIFAEADAARELNYVSAGPGPAPGPGDLYRRRGVRRNTLERVMDQLDRQRLTLQLGRFQLSLPRLARAAPRPATPDVDVDVDVDADADTYTRHGRTIRLLGADFHHHPRQLSPPSYTEAVRYKLYGPPPEYLSREGLDRPGPGVARGDEGAGAVAATLLDRDARAAANVEMPPCYEDLAGGGGGGGDHIGCDKTNNEDCTVDNCSNVDGAIDASDNDNGNVCASTVPLLNNVSCNIETLSSIIDNLPAIDSDVNANGEETAVITGNVARDNVINNDNGVINNNV